MDKTLKFYCKNYNIITTPTSVSNPRLVERVYVNEQHKKILI